jgi:hypothetical protein
MSLRPIAWLYAVFLIFACGQAALAAQSGGRWQAVLAAGDTAQPVFDNAVAAFRYWLSERGVPDSEMHRLSARPVPGDPTTEPATQGRLLGRIAGLSGLAGDRCLIFITSHGDHDGSVVLAYADEMLRPALLARTLNIGCGRVPTVVIVSSCFSGAFAAGPMLAPNRIILTAARADRPSFGCQADRTFTVYDECLLGALPRSRLWRSVYELTLACVRRREQQMDVLSSEPRGYFGAAVRDLPLP